MPSMRDIVTEVLAACECDGKRAAQLGLDDFLGCVLRVGVSIVWCGVAVVWCGAWSCRNSRRLFGCAHWPLSACLSLLEAFNKAGLHFA